MRAYTNQHACWYVVSIDYSFTFTVAFSKFYSYLNSSTPISALASQDTLQAGEQDLTLLICMIDAFLCRGRCSFTEEPLRAHIRSTMDGQESNSPTTFPLHPIKGIGGASRHDEEHQDDTMGTELRPTRELKRQGVRGPNCV